MRKSSKEMAVLNGANRLLNNDFQQSLVMEAASFATESAQEWAAGTMSVRQSPRRPLR